MGRAARHGARRGPGPRRPRVRAPGVAARPPAPGAADGRGGGGVRRAARRRDPRPVQALPLRGRHGVGRGRGGHAGRDGPRGRGRSRRRLLRQRQREPP